MCELFYFFNEILCANIGMESTNIFLYMEVNEKSLLRKNYSFHGIRRWKKIIIKKERD